MAILKKVKASSLNEVLVATIIIVLIFGIAMTILSNLLKGIHKRENYEQHTELNELIYKYNNTSLIIPYKSNNSKFEYQIYIEKWNSKKWVSFEVTSKKTNKALTKRLIANEKD